MVTSASTFSSALPTDFSFNFDLAKNTSAKDNPFYRNLFRIRYSILFELAQSQKNYAKSLTSVYSSRLAEIEGNSRI